MLLKWSAARKKIWKKSNFDIIPIQNAVQEKDNEKNAKKEKKRMKPNFTTAIENKEKQSKGVKSDKLRKRDKLRKSNH